METMHRPHRIVVVDDSADLRTMLALRLAKRSQVVVGMAGDGLEAIDVVRRAAPSLVIMDLDMPRMDGIEAGRLLRERHPDLLLVALTAHGEEASRAAAIEAGFDAYVVKGGPLQELDATLDSLPARAA